MTRQEIIAQIESSPLFGALPLEARETLAQEVRARAFAPGETARLFVQGETIRSLWLPLAGPGTGPAVQITFNTARRGGGRMALRMMPGELVGDVDLLMTGLSPRLAPHLATAEAMRPILALELPVASVSRLAAEHEPLRRRLVRDAAQRLRHLVGAATLESRWPEVNFARRLLDYFEDFGRFEGNAVHLNDKPTQQAIAASMGVSLRLLVQYLTLWSRLGLVGTRPVTILDFQRLDRIARLGDLPAAETLSDELGRLDQMFRHGAAQRVAEEAGDLLRVFPGNPALLHLMALTALHNHNPAEAARLLAPLFAEEVSGVACGISPARLQSRIAGAWIASVAPHDPEEEVEAELAFEPIAAPLGRDLMGVQARLAKDLARQETGAGRPAALTRAAQLYADIHLHRSDAYAALNAAGLFHLAGQTARVAPLARAALQMAKGSSYWDRTTRGEALLLLKETARGLAGIAEAASIAGPAERASTRRQLRLLEGAGVAGIAEALRLLEPGPVAAFSGAMLDLPGREAAPPGTCAQMQAALHDWMEARPPGWLLTGLASGADILAAEEALRRKIPCEIVLPFPPAQYVAASVGPGWTERFFRCLEKATAVTVLRRAAVTPARIERHFERANRHLLGLARLVAHRLDGTACLVTLTDNGGGSVAGTTMMQHAAEAAGLPVTSLRFPGQRPARGLLPPPPPLFAPVVRILAPEVDTPLSDRLRATGFMVHRLKSLALTAEQVIADLPAAMDLARDLAGWPEAVGATILCDFAPVLRPDGKPDSEALTQLPFIPAMAGNLLVGAEFVTEALFAGVPPQHFAELLLGENSEIVSSGARRFFCLAQGAVYGT